MAAENKTELNEGQNEMKRKWGQAKNGRWKKKSVTAFVENSFFLTCIFECPLKENTAPDLTLFLKTLHIPPTTNRICRRKDGRFRKWCILEYEWPLFNSEYEMLKDFKKRKTLTRIPVYSYLKSTKIINNVRQNIRKK